MIYEQPMKIFSSKIRMKNVQGNLSMFYRLGQSCIEAVEEGEGKLKKVSHYVHASSYMSYYTVLACSLAAFYVSDVSASELEADVII